MRWRFPERTTTGPLPQGIPVLRDNGAMTPPIDDGRLRNLIGLDGLPRSAIERLLARAQDFAAGGEAPRALAGIAVCTLFFEPSTRTRLSFQLAAQRLGA